ALTVSPHIYISCIKQFWNTASVKRSGDVTRLQALVDKKKIVISKVVIYEILQLDDAEGVVCLPNEDIFVGLAQMGYEKPSTKLTFYKAFFSSQWKFLIHIILQSLRAKRTSWNEFSTTMASAVICLLKVDDAIAAAVEEDAVEDVAHDAIPSPPLHAIRSPSQEPSSPPQQPQSSPQAPPQGAESHISPSCFILLFTLSHQIMNLNTFSGTVIEILGDVDNFLKKEKLEQVVGIVKSCSPNMLGDLNVSLKDLSGGYEFGVPKYDGFGICKFDGVCQFDSTGVCQFDGIAIIKNELLFANV
nr:synaptobrevin, longin-like domain protein [Tanacetum cinerariifolium]